MTEPATHPTSQGQPGSANPPQRPWRLAADLVRTDTALQDWPDERRAAALLIEEREHEVRGFDELVVAANGERLRVRERKLEFRCQPVHAHEGDPGYCLPR